MRRRAEKALIYCLNIIVVAMIILPFYWTVVTSLLPNSDIISYPPKLIPMRITLSNYLEIFGDKEYRRMIVNSLLVASCTSLLVCAISSLAGYAFTLNFKGKELLFFVLMAPMMIPYQVLITPLFVEMRSLGLINTYLALILAYSSNYSLPLGILIMKNMYSSIPSELKEAAKVDGCGDVKIFYKIALPLSVYALATVGIFTFIWSWNEFLMALIFMTREEMYTLPIGVALSYQPPFSIYWGKINALVTISYVPVLLLFALSQKYFMKGIVSGGIRG